MRQSFLLLGFPLLLIHATALAQAAPATPAAKPAPAPAATSDDDDDIVVTGQRPRGSVVGDIQPEQTLSQADVRAYGVNNISDLLDQLSPQTTSGRGARRRATGGFAQRAAHLRLRRDS